LKTSTNPNRATAVNFVHVNSGRQPRGDSAPSLNLGAMSHAAQTEAEFWPYPTDVSERAADRGLGTGDRLGVWPGSRWSGGHLTRGGGQMTAHCPPAGFVTLALSQSHCIVNTLQMWQ